MLAKEQENYTKYGVALFDATKIDKILKLQNMEAYSMLLCKMFLL